MFGEIFRFELRYQLRQPLFWIGFGVFFLLTFLAASVETVQIGEDMRNLDRNAPYVVLTTLRTMTLLGLLLAAAFTSAAALRDREYRSDAILFATGLARRDYLWGRFAAAYVVTCLAFAGAVLGTWAGHSAPWLAPERLGPGHPEAYAFAAYALILPNLFTLCALLFGLASLSRSAFATYLGGILVIALGTVAGAVMHSLELRELGSLVDPLANSTLSELTRYWTVFEKNSRVPELSGLLLGNRALWLGLSLALLGYVQARFRFELVEGAPAKPARRPAAEAAPRVAFRRLPGRFGLASLLRQLASQARLEVKAVLKSVPFLAALAIMVFAVAGNALFSSQELYGTPVYPLSRIMYESIRMAGEIYLLVVVIYYSAELVWRERQCGLAEIADAFPIANGVLLFGKFAALVLVVLAMLGVAVLTTLGVQLAAGQERLDFAVYGLNVGYLALGYVILAALGLALQVLLNHKYLAMGVLVLLQVGLLASHSLGWENVLYRYGELSYVFLSDMGGDHLYAPLRRWLSLYWGLAAAVLLVLAHLFWQRGRSTGFKARAFNARLRLSPGLALAGLVLLLGFAGTGAYIRHNTQVLNTYRSGTDKLAARARFERQYAQYLHRPQPKIVEVALDADLYPERRAVEVRGRYLLENKTGGAVAELHLRLRPPYALERVVLPGLKAKLEDRELGYFIYALEKPLAPGARATLEFTVAYRARGFENKPGYFGVLDNGTFISNTELPALGYFHRDRLEEPALRAEYGLPPLERMARQDDAKALANPYFSADAAKVKFAATVSTAADQTALSAGELTRSWEQDGRRYFRFEAARPIWNSYPILSARYAVSKARWKNIPIEVYYHPQHGYNVARMIAGVQKSLDYYTAAFGPYPFPSVRIAEFPHYQGQFAQAFPGLVPFSESAGFIADLRDPEKIDYVFDVTAHELAHQWWGHEVSGATVQGASLLVETLAQYSALMVSEKEYGREQMRKFLRYELDNYLKGRGGEKQDEMPLWLVEKQSYIHYFKGSLAMYALREYIGEERINRALRRFLADFRGERASYPTSADLLRYLRAETPEEWQELVTDLFERIVLFDLKITEASRERLADGRYRVRFSVAAQKFAADGRGRESARPLADYIELGVFAAKERAGAEARPLYLAKHKLAQETHSFEFVVDGEPASVGIDPRNLLIDRLPEDNRMMLEP